MKEKLLVTPVGDSKCHEQLRPQGLVVGRGSGPDAELTGRLVTGSHGAAWGHRVENHKEATPGVKEGSGQMRPREF